MDRKRTDVGGLVERYLDMIAAEQTEKVAQDLALLHPFVSQQMYARARTRDAEYLMVLLTPEMWRYASRDLMLQQEGTAILRNLVTAIQVKDPLKIKTAMTVAFNHFARFDSLPADGEFTAEVSP